MYYSSHDVWRKIGVVAVVLAVVLLGCVSAFAETLTVTAEDGLVVTYNGADPDNRVGSHELTLVSMDNTFILRDPSDPVVYDYLLQGQASAEAVCLLSCTAAAHVHGTVSFSFNLPNTPSLWDIDLNYEYHGVVAAQHYGGGRRPCLGTDDYTIRHRSALVGEERIYNWRRCLGLF